jgi:hypothetical protein
MRHLFLGAALTCFGIAVYLYLQIPGPASTPAQPVSAPKVKTEEEKRQEAALRKQMEEEAAKERKANARGYTTQCDVRTIYNNVWEVSINKAGFW